MLEVKNISKYFKGKAALKNVSITLAAGKMYELVGNNGAGKTTLLNCIASQYKVEEGTILFNNHELSYKDLSHIAYYMDHTLFDGCEYVKDVMKEYQFFFEDFNEVRMKTFMDELEIKEDEQLSDMSLGTRKKCELAFVLARDAQLFLLDEPFANLDPLLRSELIKMMVHYSREDACYVISTHQVQEIESYVDDTILIKDGKLVLQGNNDDLRQEYGCTISELLLKKLAER